MRKLEEHLMSNYKRNDKFHTNVNSKKKKKFAVLIKLRSHEVC